MIWMRARERKRGILFFRDWRVPTSLIKFTVPITKSFWDAVGVGGEGRGGVLGEDFTSGQPTRRIDGAARRFESWQVKLGRRWHGDSRNINFPARVVGFLATFAFPISCLCASFWSRLQERANERVKERKGGGNEGDLLNWGMALETNRTTRRVQCEKT